MVLKQIFQQAAILLVVASTLQSGQSATMRRLVYISVPTNALKSVKESEKADFFSYDLSYGTLGQIRVGCSGDRNPNPPSDNLSCIIKPSDEFTFELGKYRKYYHLDRKTNHIKMITFKSTDGRNQTCTILILRGPQRKVFNIADAIHPN